MTKNLLKIGSLIFMAIVVVVLLIFGNPNAPTIIEKGNLKLVGDGDIKNPNVNFFKKDQKILIFNPWDMWIKYNGTQKKYFLILQTQHYLTEAIQKL